MPSQRERLMGGMTAVAARYGYGDATVARVLEQTGVSRATFYSCFPDREACFLAAFGEIEERIDAGLATGTDGEVSGERARGALAALLATTARCPEDARLVLIEALAAGPPVRDRYELLLDRVEDFGERWLAGRARAGSVLELSGRSLLGALSSVIATRVFQEAAAELPDLVEDLLVWAGSYAMPAGHARLGSAGWARLGAAAAAGREIDPQPAPQGETPRDRILAAVARVSREKGFAEMTVGDVTAAAGLSRETFYSHFRTKEDAFLTTQAMGLQESVSAAAGHFFEESDWPDRVWNGLEAMLTFVASQPDLVFVDLVESYAAGPAAIRRSYENWMAYTLFLEEGYRQRPEAESLPRVCSEAIGGTIHELLRLQVVRGRSATALEILPEAAYVALAPFIGAGEALKLVEARSSARS